MIFSSSNIQEKDRRNTSEESLDDCIISSPLAKLQTLAEQIYEQEISQQNDRIENCTTALVFDSLEFPLELETLEQKQEGAPSCTEYREEDSKQISSSHYECVQTLHTPLPSELYRVCPSTFIEQLEAQSQQIYQDIRSSSSNHTVDDMIYAGNYMTRTNSFQEEEPLDRWLVQDPRDDQSKHQDAYKKQMTSSEEIQFIDLTFLIPPKPQSNTPFSDFIVVKRDIMLDNGPIINPMDTSTNVFDGFSYQKWLATDNINLSVIPAPTTEETSTKEKKKYKSLSSVLPQRIPLDYEAIKMKESPLLALKIHADKILKRQYFVENAHVTLQMMQTNQSIENQRIKLFEQVDSKVLERLNDTNQVPFGQDIHMLFSCGSKLVEKDEKRLQIAPERLEKEAERIYQYTVRRIQEQMPSSLLGCSLQIGLIWNLIASKMLTLMIQKEELPVVHKVTDSEKQQQPAVIMTVEEEPKPVKIEDECCHSDVIESKPTETEPNSIETPTTSGQNNPVNQNQVQRPSTKTLVDSFFDPKVKIAQDTQVNTKASDDFKISFFLNELSRSALWEMMQKKLVAKGMTFEKITFHQLNTLYQQLQSHIRRMIKLQQQQPQQQKQRKPTAKYPSSENDSREITSVCQSFRQIIWLLALKTLFSFIDKVKLLHPTLDKEEEIMRISVNTFWIEIGKSKFWKQAIGPRRWNELEGSFRPFLEFEKPKDEPITILSSCNKGEAGVGSPPRKRSKRDEKFTVERDISSMARWLSVNGNSVSVWPSKKTDKTENPLPVRVLCSPSLLYKNELLADELCTEYQVTMIERDSIGGRLVELAMMLLDEHHGLLLFQMRDLVEETLMKHTIYELVAIQHQFQKCWVILQNYQDDEDEEQHTRQRGEADTNETLGTFYSALVHFHIDIQPIMTFSIEETCIIIRQCLDSCASKALQTRKVLPRFWFERPFLLEQESQHERFLSSTRIMNAFAAQSLLQRHSLRELCLQGFEEFQATTSGILSTNQLELLWSALHQNYGLNTGISYH